MNDKIYKTIARDLGATCRRFRKSIDMTLSDVARDTGYTIQNISAFECGHNNNMKIYLWYVDHGLNYFIDLTKAGETNGTDI